LHLRGRQAGLLVGKQVLEGTSKSLLAFDDLGLIPRSLRAGDGKVAVVIFGQFE
jgi:hypothetical protein